MEAVVTAGLGFLAAVLWFDLMHDVLARGSSDDLPEEDLETIARYYARVTTAARPMNMMVAAVMAMTIVAVAAEIARGGDGLPLAVLSGAFLLIGVGTAAARTVRTARRLGARTDDLATQRELAGTILRDHLVCLSAIATAMVLQFVLIAIR